MEKKDKEPESFQVVDKRQFTSEGERRPDAPPPETPPAASVATGPIASETRAPAPAEASFPELVILLADYAALFMGDAPNPATGKAETDLPAARHFIDLLLLLEDKTRNNLSAKEAQLLRGVITQLQLLFVERSKPANNLAP
jgi:hypothetical protein